MRHKPGRNIAFTKGERREGPETIAELHHDGNGRNISMLRASCEETNQHEAQLQCVAPVMLGALKGCAVGLDNVGRYIFGCGRCRGLAFHAYEQGKQKCVVDIAKKSMAARDCTAKDKHALKKHTLLRAGNRFRFRAVRESRGL